MVLFVRVDCGNIIVCCRRSDDPLVRDCVRSFTQDWTVVNRKYVSIVNAYQKFSSQLDVLFRYGSFHGQDESLLLRRFSSCKRTPSYSKLLPQHSYEVDMPKEDGISVS